METGAFYHHYDMIRSTGFLFTALLMFSLTTYGQQRKTFVKRIKNTHLSGIGKIRRADNLSNTYAPPLALNIKNDSLHTATITLPAVASQNFLFCRIRCISLFRNNYEEAMHQYSWTQFNMIFK
ncbi:MAG: hypothetical protein EOP47_15635 [Sphingobacteriaceae bacterium]|nr:MAG: hypothetical protein EOP47_15635 [Sphingobacteriaceae bacterium]